MNAVEYIKQHISPIKILEHYNFKHIQDREYEIRSCCGIHGGDNTSAFLWNKTNDLWICFTGNCGGGDVFDLVMKMEDCNFLDSINITANILGIDIDNMEIGNDDRILQDQKKWLNKNINNKKNEFKEFNNFTYTKQENAKWNRFKEYTQKHFNVEIIDNIVIKKEDKEIILYNKILIPIKINNKLIGVALRSLNDEVPKWIYQPKGLRLSDTLFNLDNAVNDKTEELILVEGIFDVFAFHEIGVNNVVAIYGSSISKQQYETLMKLNVKLISCFDEDDAGRKCTKNFNNMFKNKCDIGYIKLKDDTDPDDIGRKELLSTYLNRS